MAARYNGTIRRRCSNPIGERRVIPRTEIEVVWDDPANVAGFPDVDDLLSDTFDGNRLYDPGVLDRDWTDAADALAIEQRLVEAASIAGSAEEFDELLDDDLEDDELMLLGGLDIGVAGTVVALAAAGCAPSTSCRGHHVSRPGSSVVPEVVFWCDHSRAALVRAAAVKAGCSFGVDDEGRASVWAPSVLELMTLARLIVRSREDLEALPPPPWRR